MRKFIIAMLSLSLVISLCACGNEKEDDIKTNTNKDNITIETEQEKDEQQDEVAKTDVDYSQYTADYPVEKRTLDYYWNIDTSGFDKTQFDGIFSLFGNDFNGKITGKTLKDNGYQLQIGSGLFTELMLDKDNNCYSDKSNGAYILKDDVEYENSMFLKNYKNETDLYSDNTEIKFYWGTTDKKFSDIIFPKCLVAGQDENVGDNLKIDDIIEKLGVPTYVEERTDSSIEDKMHFTYIYVYDDYVFEFGMTYLSSDEESTEIGNAVTSYWYVGMQTYDQPCKYYDAESDEMLNYDSPFDFLKKDQEKYLKSIK